MSQTLVEKLRTDPPDREILYDFERSLDSTTRNCYDSIVNLEKDLITPSYKIALKGGLSLAAIRTALTAIPTTLTLSALALVEYLRHGEVQTQTSDLFYTGGGTLGLMALGWSALGLATFLNRASDLKKKFKKYLQKQKERYNFHKKYFDGTEAPIHIDDKSYEKVIKYFDCLGER